MKPTRLLTLAAVILTLSTGCSDQTEQKKASLTEGGMKCGAGKCGANMVDGNTLLAKKQRNILAQMRDDDPRKDCVMKAQSTKALYDCVRDPKTGKLTTKCGTGKCGDGMASKPAMKCGAGKCGASMQKPKPKPAMKCGAGKCGGAAKKAAPGSGKCGTMKKAEPKAAMKCGAGKCGSGM